MSVQSISRTLTILLCLSFALVGLAQLAPEYLWFEPEWFSGVEGGYGYWSGTMTQPLGHWGVAGPGISAEFTQGGESEWNSMGVPAAETNAVCWRNITVPRTGKYRLWVRYVDHRQKSEPFTVQLEQGGKVVMTHEFGVKPVVPENDEYMLYWDFSFGWDAQEGQLEAGPAKLSVMITRPGEEWRQVDALLLTDDLAYTPVGREKPHFAYMDAFKLQPAVAPWRGSGKGLKPGTAWKRNLVAGKDFTMWVTIDADKTWWGKQKLDSLKLYDTLFQFTPPADIRDKFHQQFAGKTDIPVMSWSNYIPGFYLGEMPDFSPESPVRKWLEQTKTPFYICLLYTSPNPRD